MMDTEALSPGSNMPNYPWLAKKKTNIDSLPSKMAALRTLGVPYQEMSDEAIINAANAQASQIATGLKASQIDVDPDRQIVALIAYLQQLGKPNVDTQPADLALNPTTN